MTPSPNGWLMSSWYPSGRAAALDAMKLALQLAEQVAAHVDAEPGHVVRRSEPFHMVVGSRRIADEPLRLPLPT